MDTTSFTYPVVTVDPGRPARFWHDHPIISDHPIVSGALGGLLWGVLMRLWMRFVSTDPEFSWSGTGFILGAALLAGLGLGTAYAWSRRARRGWWRALGFPLILLGAGAGSIMLPGVIIGGVALGRRTWPRAVRTVLLTVAIGGTLALIGLTSEDGFGPVKTVVALALFAVLHTIEIAAAGIVFGPNRSRRDPLYATPIAAESALGQFAPGRLNPEGAENTKDGNRQSSVPS